MTQGSAATVRALELGEVTLPAGHPRADDRTCVIRAFVIDHPDGVVVVDTGVGSGNDLINELYRPTVVPLVRALNDAGLDERDVVAIINTHLHFDHCGQNAALPGAAVYLQRAEVDAAAEPHFTVAEWASVEPARLRLIDGDEVIAPGVEVIATPGHTPGHQSVLVNGGGHGRCLVVGQCCYNCHEFRSGELLPDDSHDAEWVQTSRASLQRLRSLEAERAVFSHDRTIFVA